MASSEITFFASFPKTPMWFIPNARSLMPGPITAKRASYPLCFFEFAAKYWSTGVFCKCGNVCRCICGEHSNVVGSVCRRVEEVRPIGWSAPEIVRLMNDCHSASAKGNLCKGVLDSIVAFGYSNICYGVVSILFSRCWGACVGTV